MVGPLVRLVRLRDRQECHELAPARRALIDVRLDATPLVARQVVVQITRNLGLGQMHEAVELHRPPVRTGHACGSSSRFTQLHGCAGCDLRDVSEPTSLTR
jgi:hypothetical protein